MMRLHVTKVEAPGKFDNQALPVVHFGGASRSVDVGWDPNANSKIRGTVRLTPDGEVRWTTVSIFYGYDFFLFFSSNPICISHVSEFLTQTEAVKSAGVAKASKSAAHSPNVALSAPGSTKTTINMVRLGLPRFGKYVNLVVEMRILSVRIVSPMMIGCIE